MRKIDENLLKKAVFGAVNTYIEEGELIMCRFSQRQIDYFAQINNYIEKSKKSKASAGIHIDFYTDATELKIEFECSIASSQAPCFVDLYVDGVMKEHFGYSEETDRKIEKTVNFNQGLKRITLWLPCLFQARIKDFSLNSDLFKPAEKDVKILFVGDSITQGYTSEFPSLTYTNIVTRELNAECVNQGIGGAVFDEMDLDENLPFSPDIVVIAYGTNDWAHGNERDLESNATAYIEKICRVYKNAKKYAVTPIWRGMLEKKDRNAVMSFEEMHILLEDIYKNFDIKVIDGMKLVPHREEFFMSDVLHPNELGFLHYGNNLLKEILK